MSVAVFEPYSLIFDRDGQPLENGYLWFGTAAQNPQTNPIVVYWDQAGTQIAAQPIRTSGGYPVRNGAPARVYVNADDYSLVVRDKNQRLISSQLTAPVFGSAFVGFLQSGTGAVTRTVQAKLRETVSVSDFGAAGDGIIDDTIPFQAAIASFGASSGQLLVITPVKITADVTVPANVQLCILGAGLIIIASGKRLYINGPFSCDRLKQAFSCSPVVLTVTANANANALNITATSANSVAAGMTVEGTGIAGGTMIAADYGVTGVGQVALNMYQGVLGNRTMTLTGSAVIFAKGTVDQVYPQWFGASADGTTDNTAAFRLAVYSIRWGGKVKVPAGKYRVLGSAVVHGGLTIEGDGPGDTNTGSPPTAATQAPTYIFVDADSTNIFTVPPKADHITFRDISFGTSLTTGTTPVGTNRKGIVLNGHAPQFLFMPRFDNCYFFQFQTGILVNDDWAQVGDGYAPSGYYWNGVLTNATSIVQGTAYEIAVVGTTNWAAITGTLISGVIGTVGCRFLPNAVVPTGTGTAYAMPVYYDWGVNPGVVEGCEFRGNTYGIQFNTTNADAWRLVNCNFSIPANASGVYLTRCGYLRMESCFGFGASAANSEFVNLVGNGVTALDTITLDKCQAEYCSHFINYSAASTTSISVIINVLNCIHQLNADIYLGRMCQYNSYNTQVQSMIYVDAANVRVSSINDWHQWVNFSSGPTFRTIVVSGDANSIYTYIPGRYPSSSLTGPILNGVYTFGGSGAGNPTGVVTPSIVGQEYLDTATSKWYKATGLAAANWVALN
jgi:hypothetical protein